jgi:histidine triad (HIT) family protein
MSTLFTKIIDGDLPGSFVHRDHHCVVFMSINPISTGHALVVPKVEVDHWLDLPEDIAAHLFAVAARIGRAQTRAFSNQRTALIIVGFEINHCHLHVIPANSMADVSFENADLQADPSVLQQAAQLIQQHLV